MEATRYQLCVAFVAALLAFFNLGVPGLFDEDEPKNAACGQEMLARADWIVPTFNYELRADKPILLYWFMLAAYHLLGVSEFSARLPSAVFAVGTSLVVYHLGSRLYGARLGLWAGIILATCLNWNVVARAATPDSVFIFFCTAALLAYVLAAPGWSRRGSEPAPCADDWRQFVPRVWWACVPMYGLMGLAVLAKGPAGMILPCGAIGLFLLVMRRPLTATSRELSGWGRLRAGIGWLKELFAPRGAWEVIRAMRPLLGLVVMGAVALPWYIAVGLETRGAWLVGFLGKHNVGRFVHAMEGHRGPIFYYLIAIAIGFFPWSLFLWPALLRWRARIRDHAAAASDRLVACWAVFYIGLFSLSGTKLPNYVLPAYPALALLTAAMMVDWLAAPAMVGKLRPALAFGTLAAVGLGLMIALPVVAFFLLPGEWGLAGVGLIPLAGGVLCLRMLRADRLAKAMQVFAVTATLQAMAIFGFATVRVARHQTSEALLARATGQERNIAVFEYFEPSLTFYARQQVKRFAKPEQVEAFFANSGQPYLITQEKYLPHLGAAIPADVEILARKRRFLRNGDVVLLGRRTEVARRDSGHVH
jgi:4-amino-4-deoxy-L-arabinose transferase-like glycosyltransferase